MEKWTIFEKITSEYYMLTASERKVADYILQQREKTQYMAISDLAEDCEVAEATITRFCKRLGYKGYNALKLGVANATASQRSGVTLPGEISEQDSLSELCQKCAALSTNAVAQTLEKLDISLVSQGVALLENAKKVLCMGQGGSMLLAQQSAHLFSTTFPHFQAVSDSHDQIIAISHMQKDDVALVFSYSGSTTELQDMLPLIEKKQAKSILITRFPKSPGGSSADLVIPCGANEAPLQLGSVPAAISQLFLIDLLFQELCRRNQAEITNTREAVAKALLEKHL